VGPRPRARVGRSTDRRRPAGLDSSAVKSSRTGSAFSSAPFVMAGCFEPVVRQVGVVASAVPVPIRHNVVDKPEPSLRGCAVRISCGQAARCHALALPTHSPYLKIIACSGRVRMHKPNRASADSAGRGEVKKDHKKACQPRRRLSDISHGRGQIVPSMPSHRPPASPCARRLHRRWHPLSPDERGQPGLIEAR
jgi:hypothetical protein